MSPYLRDIDVQMEKVHRVPRAMHENRSTTKSVIKTFQSIGGEEETLRASSGREKGLFRVSMASDFKQKATLNGRKPWNKASKF